MRTRSLNIIVIFLLNSLIISNILGFRRELLPMACGLGRYVFQSCSSLLLFGGRMYWRSRKGNTYFVNDDDVVWHSDNIQMGILYVIQIKWCVKRSDLVSSNDEWCHYSVVSYRSWKYLDYYLCLELSLTCSIPVCWEKRTFQCEWS